MNNEPMTTTISQMRALVECSDIHEIPSRQIRSALDENEKLIKEVQRLENIRLGYRQEIINLLNSQREELTVLRERVKFLGGQQREVYLDAMQTTARKLGVPGLSWNDSIECWNNSATKAAPEKGEDDK